MEVLILLRLSSSTFSLLLLLLLLLALTILYPCYLKFGTKITSNGRKMLLVAVGYVNGFDKVLPSRLFPSKTYLFKVHNKTTIKRREICSRLTPERCKWRHCGVFIANFEHILHLFPLTLNRQMFAGFRYTNVIF